MVVPTIDQTAVLLSRIKQNMKLLQVASESTESQELFQKTLKERLDDVNDCLAQLWAGMD